MSEIPLTDRQKDLVLALSDALDKGLGTTVVIFKDGSGVTVIFDRGDKDVYPHNWKNNIKESDLVKFEELGYLKKGRSALDEYRIHRDAQLIKAENMPQASLPITETTHSDPQKVFVIYGRNEKIRKELFHFLRAIGLKPLEWSDLVTSTEKGTPYIGEVLEVAFKQAQAVVVLMTPDDEARLKLDFHQADDSSSDTELTGQARPNVLFEAGMAMGLNPNRTIILELGKLRPFSDISGRHVIRLDRQHARYDLANRLENAGCPVNINGRDWLTTGDFTL
jgi:predicted nucleotide-binding protein